MPMSMFGAMQDPYDKPFQRVTDLPAFTAALVSAGYHPYELHRRDNGHVQTVWAKSGADVREYSPGVAARVSMEPGYVVQPPIVVVLDKLDGGHVNVNGTHLPCVACMST